MQSRQQGDQSWRTNSSRAGDTIPPQPHRRWARSKLPAGPAVSSSEPEKFLPRRREEATAPRVMPMQGRKPGSFPAEGHAMAHRSRRTGRAITLALASTLGIVAPITQDRSGAGWQVAAAAGAGKAGGSGAGRAAPGRRRRWPKAARRRYRTSFGISSGTARRRGCRRGGSAARARMTTQARRGRGGAAGPGAAGGGAPGPGAAGGGAPTGAVQGGKRHAVPWARLAGAASAIAIGAATARSGRAGSPPGRAGSGRRGARSPCRAAGRSRPQPFVARAAISRAIWSRSVRICRPPRKPR